MQHCRVAIQVLVSNTLRCQPLLECHEKWWASSLLIICHLTVYQSQGTPSCLCESWIFLLYGVINFTWIISLSTQPCFDECGRWLKRTMCFLLCHCRLQNAAHDKQERSHRITQMCWRGDVYHSITWGEAHRQSDTCKRHEAFDCVPWRETPLDIMLALEKCGAALTASAQALGQYFMRKKVTLKTFALRKKDLLNFL